MAFNPDTYLKKSPMGDQGGGFNPDTYLSKPGSEKKEGAGQAFLEHAGNRALGDYLPHVQAVVEGALPDPTARVDAKLRSEGFRVPEGQTYLERRDANIARMAQQKKDFPIASGLGDIAGIGAMALLPAGAVSKAATLGGRVVQGAKTGAVLGALANPGDKEGEFSPAQIGERFQNALFGAALGAGSQAAIEGAGALAGKAGNLLRSSAEKRAFKALGGGSKVTEKMQASGRDKAIGRTLLDEGAVPILGTPGRIGKRVDRLKDSAGKEIGELVRGEGAQGKVIDATEMALELLDSKKVAQLRKTPGMESLAGRVDKLADTLSSNGQMSLEQAHGLRQAIDQSINFSKQVPEMRGLQSILYDLRSMINQRMDSAVGGGKLKAANKAYSNLAEASSIAGKRVARDAANRSISLTDTIAGAGGLAAGGGPLLALAAGTANKATRTFGAAAAARGTDSLASAMLKIPKLAQMAEASPVAFQAIVNRLTQGPVNEKAEEDPILNNPEILGILEKSPALIERIQDPKLRAEILKRVGRKPAEGDNAMKRRFRDSK